MSAEKYAEDFVRGFLEKCAQSKLPRAEIIECINDIIDMGYHADQWIRQGDNFEKVSSIVGGARNILSTSNDIGYDAGRAIYDNLVPPKFYANDTGPDADMLKLIKDQEKEEVYKREAKALQRRLRIMKAKKEQADRLNRRPMNRLFL